MTYPLFLADLDDAQPGALIEITGDEGRHAAVVKRLRVGEKVLLADGKGSGLSGEVTQVTKAGISVVVDELITRDEPELRVVAVQALAKGERSDIAVEAMTELGISEIIAWQSARSIVRWQNKAEKGLAKWQSAAISATKQSRRFRIPQVNYATTEQLCQRITEAQCCLVLHEDATEALSHVQLPATGECLIVIGPEGGITPEELDAFKAAGAQIVSISDAVLRTSTAGVVALAQIQALHAVHA